MQDILAELNSLPLEKFEVDERQTVEILKFFTPIFIDLYGNVLGNLDKIMLFVNEKKCKNDLTQNSNVRSCSSL